MKSEVYLDVFARMNAVSIGDGTGMNCVDIVIGSAVGQLSRVGDYYTADRSTPRHDEFYGGTQSLTAAIASQSNDGVTTVIFRRPISGTQPRSTIIIIIIIIIIRRDLH